jgi:ssDNA-binding Zn-finger/Zn-ribbon topoisomerase 1
MGLNPIDVFDFEFEELREDIQKPDKTVILCKECNTDDVIIRGHNKGLCMICGKDVETYTTELRADAKVIGYQVLSNTTDCALHPKMEASFCLYSLKQCKKIVGGETTNWKIQTYWSGDIEEPTMMFHNSPDNNHKK